MRFTDYVIAKRSKEQLKSPFPNATIEYWDGNGYWCHNIIHAKRFMTQHDAQLTIRSMETRWPSVYEYTVEEHEECDY